MKKILSALILFSLIVTTPTFAGAAITHLSKGNPLPTRPVLLAPVTTTTIPSGYRTNYNPDGTLAPTAPFQSFGNLTGEGDCQYESDANLVLSQWPSSSITTDQVVAAYQSWGVAWDSDGLTAGQHYLMEVGFAGHRASSITQVYTVPDIIAATNSGGVEVIWTHYPTAHMFDIISATTTGLTMVNDGFVQLYTWPDFFSTFTPNGWTLSFYAVKWSS